MGEKCLVRGELTMLKGDEITDRGVPEKAGDEWTPEAGRINMGG